MSLRAFRQIDVFTAEPYRGNALAVVLDGKGLTDAQLQRFARWTNLSETTFLSPPTDAGADYSVRIFTPGGELPFAGHPTLGSCHAWLEAGGRQRHADFIIQQCQVGLVRLRRDGSRLAFSAPPLRRSAPDPQLVTQVTAAIGHSSAPGCGRASSGQRAGLARVCWWTSPATVLALAPDHAELKRLGHKVGVAAIYPDAAPAEPQLEVRAFAAPIGITEDPVTGSLNASLAQWLMQEERLPPRYISAQGACLDRAGRVYLERDSDGAVWVGGDSVTCISGSVLI